MRTSVFFQSALAVDIRKVATWVRVIASFEIQAEAELRTEARSPIVPGIAPCLV